MSLECAFCRDCTLEAISTQVFANQCTDCTVVLFARASVNYVAADLFELESEWRGAFDLVVEVNTLQVLPPELRPAAISAMVNCVTPGGYLLVIARGREPNDEQGSMPWPLIKGELELFVQSGLKLISFEDFLDEEEPPVRRFRVQYRKPIEGKP